MIGLPPGGNVGVKAPQVRDHPKPVITRAERVKVAWAESIADEPVMLMGRAADGRFVSLKQGARK